MKFSDALPPKPNRLRWQRGVLIAAIVLVILLHESIEVSWLVTRANYVWVAVDLFVLLAFGALAYLAVDRLLRVEITQASLQERLQTTEKQLSETLQRQKTILGIGQMYAEAVDEDQVMDITLHLSQELLGAKGATFVPLDEHAQPLAARVVGEMPVPAASTWMEYLASPAVRQKCGTCQTRETFHRNCPLIQGTFLDSMGVYCLPVRRNDQELGILNLYFPTPGNLDTDLQSLVRTLLDEAALALEGIRLRDRAMSTLRQLQVQREKTDLDAILLDLLNGLHDTLDADFSMVSIWDAQSGLPNTTVTSGQIPDAARHLVDGALQSARTSGEPVMLENLTSGQSHPDGLRALMVVPLVVQGGPVSGALLVSSRRTRGYNQRQLAMLQTIAGQAALVVQNTYLIAQLEYRAVMEERRRLAREIHDGLAQTLGFLKLKASQMRSHLAQNDLQGAAETVETVYTVVSDAYQEARQAIDGLRSSPSEDGLAAWLEQAAADFEEYCEIGIAVYPPAEPVQVAPEVLAQLVRIVQEALNNIRKHASAARVEIHCAEEAGELVLEICDDGAGFDVHELPVPSQHGLRGMRERADLIGADFQVVSQLGQGTRVRIHLPLKDKVKE